MTELYGGIEGGGTKFVCAIGTGPDDIRAEARFPTTTPTETLPKVIDFFKEQIRAYGNLAGLGIASFGPVDLKPQSPTYGYITSTPKPGWAFFNFMGTMKQVMDIPMGFETDVNMAALGEWTWGAGKGLDTFVYLTIGTGIGGGIIAGGKLIHGLVHPEIGHILLPHDRQADPFEGSCPYHKDCFEGLANGPAIEKRWGQRGETLPLDHPAWELEAHYLALAVESLVVTLSPERVALGGGVMEQPRLFPMVREKVQRMLNGYVKSDQILEHMDTYIVPPGLGRRSGVMGALALARQVAG